MKTLRISVLISLIGLFAIVNSTFAQTKQVTLHGTVTDVWMDCINATISGEWTYHATYHFNKKTGMMSNLHWNIQQSDIWDSEGNRYQVMDTGNDNIGGLWDLLNSLNAYNAAYGADVVYVPGDGWLPVPDMEDRPEEGHLVGATFKYIGNGHKFTMRMTWHLHMNAHGDIIVDKSVDSFECK